MDEVDILSVSTMTTKQEKLEEYFVNFAIYGMFTGK
jgi:hypothetical protein